MKRRWVIGGLSALAIVMLGITLVVMMQYGPMLARGRQMEKFCAGLPGTINQGELKALAEQEGYEVKPGSDAKGPYLQLDDDASAHHYRCQARFKPSGEIDSINFRADVKD